MNWFKKAQYIYDQDRNVYIGIDKGYIENLSEEEKEQYYEEKRKKRKEWDEAIQYALSTGKISPEEAETKGYIWQPASNIKQLPQKLYHVTTAKNKVLKTRLKTREELEQAFGKGLGGGDKNTISFTDDINTALGIYEALIEAKKVSSQEMSAEDMIRKSIEGENSKEPWIDMIKEYYKIKDENDLNNFINLIDGEYTLKTDFPMTEKEFNERYYDGKGKWTPLEESIRDENKKLYTKFYRPSTEEEKIERLFSFYKTWSSFREHKGGPLNPVFFLSDPIALSQVPYEEIGVLEYQSKPGSLGFQVGSLGEWRTWSGDAIELSGVVK